MELVNAWNELTYFDGILFTIWLGILYIGKKPCNAPAIKQIPTKASKMTCAMTLGDAAIKKALSSTNIKGIM